MEQHLLRSGTNDLPKTLSLADLVFLGIGSIMNAKRVVLLATGYDKAEVVRRAIREDIDPATQASILRTHPNVTILLDRAAASKL